MGGGAFFSLSDKGKRDLALTETKKQDGSLYKKTSQAWEQRRYPV